MDLTGKIFVVKVPIDPRGKQTTKETARVDVQLIRDGELEHECVDDAIISVDNCSGGEEMPSVGDGMLQCGHNMRCHGALKPDSDRNV
jgi:hypothetical protein